MNLGLDFEPQIPNPYIPKSDWEFLDFVQHIIQKSDWKLWILDLSRLPRKRELWIIMGFWGIQSNAKSIPVLSLLCTCCVSSRLCARRLVARETSRLA